MSPNITHRGVHTRAGRWVAVSAAAALVAGGAGLLAAQAATAAPSATWSTPPSAQSAGNFVDATAGGNTIDSVVKLDFARADYDGTTNRQSTQNPLHAKALNAVDLPLTGTLQLPGLLGIKLGAANQVASINTDTGKSYGASGAVLNSGGVSVGGNNGAYPSSATVDLSGSALLGGSGAAADALGGITMSVNGLSAIAASSGWGDDGSPTYTIGDLTLNIGAPGLGQALSTALGQVTTALGQVATAAGAVTQTLTGCDLTSGTVPSTLSLEGGAVVIDPATGALTVSLNDLLQQLGLDINDLPANTDLVAYLLNYLTSSDGLAQGVTNVVNGLVDPLAAQYKNCEAVINALPAGGLLTTLLNTLTSAQGTLESTATGLTNTLTAAGGTNPLTPLASGLKQALDIGANVQPLVSSGDFTSNLTQRLPKQGMTPPAKPYTTLVRALEVDVLGGAVTLGLANAADGPSIAGVAAAPPSPANSGGVAPVSTGNPGSSGVLPTGVNAGHGTTGGMPAAPLILLVSGLLMAGGGALAWRLRGLAGRHLG